MLLDELTSSPSGRQLSAADQNAVATIHSVTTKCYNSTNTSSSSEKKRGKTNRGKEKNWGKRRRTSGAKSRIGAKRKVGAKSIIEKKMDYGHTYPLIDQDR